MLTYIFNVYLRLNLLILTYNNNLNNLNNLDYNIKNTVKSCFLPKHR